MVKIGRKKRRVSKMSVLNPIVEDILIHMPSYNNTTNVLERPKSERPNIKNRMANLKKRSDKRLENVNYTKIPPKQAIDNAKENYQVAGASQFLTIE